MVTAIFLLALLLYSLCVHRLLFGIPHCLLLHGAPNIISAVSPVIVVAAGCYLNRTNRTQQQREKKNTEELFMHCV